MLDVIMINSPVLSSNDKLPIKTNGLVHSGKVRSVYWLTEEDSKKLIQRFDYPVHFDTQLGVMIISDRLSAFECIWHAENNLTGVPNKGAALNAISYHWFSLFKEQGLADNHIVAMPHPLVWIVQKAKPVMIEAIARQYITGSMWRDYEKGVRSFCGVGLPEHLQRNQKLEKLLITPSTKGVIEGVQGVPAVDDVNISKENIIQNLSAFCFNSEQDVVQYENLLQSGFSLISEQLARHHLLFVDTKFEFGYVKDIMGNDKLIYIDEVGTPDSSRIWDEKYDKKGVVIESSKEGFRQALLDYCPDSDILTNKNRFVERVQYAKETTLPESFFMSVSHVYQELAEMITGKPLIKIEEPLSEIVDILNDYQLIK